jgi:hypothetical protein
MPDPWIIVPPKNWAMQQWVALVVLALNIILVMTFVVHGLRSGSSMSFIYAMIGGASTLSWLALRRENRDAARVADAMILPLQFLLLRLAGPAMDWLGW